MINDVLIIHCILRGLQYSAFQFLFVYKHVLRYDPNKIPSCNYR
jgi:hypothetical protein